MKARLKFNPEESYVGYRWRRGDRRWGPCCSRDGAIGYQVANTLDVWICLIPCLSLHLRFERLVQFEPIRC